MSWRVSILLLLVAGAAWGQETPKPSLTIFVRENNSSGRPLQGVQISAPKVSPAVTETDGRKTLVFPKHEVGEILELTVFLPGFEVVNDLQRTVTLPKDPRSELNFFLCEPAQCLAERLSFYRLSADPLRRNIEARYEKRLEEIATKGLATAKELGRVESERVQALATVDRLTEELAHLKPGEGSISYRRAVQLFTEGKLEEALQELDTAKLDQAREQVRSQLEEVTRSYILRGRILVAQSRLIEAEAAYEEAVATSPQSVEATFALAFVLGERQLFARAAVAYESSLKLARELRDTPMIAANLTNIGNLHINQNRKEDAQKAYEEALGSYRQLAAGNPEVYMPSVSGALHNVGNVYSDQNRVEDARKAYAEALEIRRQLAAQKPDVHLHYVAGTLHNLGNLHRNQNRMEDARKAYEEALEIHRQLATKKTEVYLRKVAGTLNSLGSLHREQNRMEDARKAYEEALESYRQLADQKPDVYLPFVASTLNNLGSLHRDQSRVDDARKAYKEAVQITRDFATINPERFAPILAQTLEFLGGSELKASQFEAASVLFTEALATRKRIASSGQAQKTAIIKTTGLLAQSFALAGKTADAVPTAQEALSLIGALEPAELNAFDPMVEALRKILDVSPPLPVPANPQPEPQGDDRDSGSGGGFAPSAAEQRPPMSVGVW